MLHDDAGGAGAAGQADGNRLAALGLLLFRAAAGLVLAAGLEVGSLVALLALLLRAELERTDTRPQNLERNLCGMALRYAFVSVG